MLESLELTSLKSIRNGIVNVFSNPDLCFAETVNWSMIVSEPKKKNNIMTNKPMEDCGKICSCFKGQWHNHVRGGLGRGQVIELVFLLVSEAEYSFS